MVNEDIGLRKTHYIPLFVSGFARNTDMTYLEENKPRKHQKTNIIFPNVVITGIFHSLPSILFLLELWDMGSLHKLKMGKALREWYVN